MISVICGYCSHKEGLEAPVKTAVDKFQLLPAFLKVCALFLLFGVRIAVLRFKRIGAV